MDIGTNIGLCGSCKSDREKRYQPRQRLRLGAGHELSQEDYAGFWLRWVAWMIDGLIIFLGVTIFDAILKSIFHFTVLGFFERYSNNLLLGNGPTSFTGTSLLLTSVFAGAAFVIANVMTTFLWFWLYYACFESSSLQATPGKLLLKLQVTDLQHSQLTFRRATARWFAKDLFLVPIFMACLCLALGKSGSNVTIALAGCFIMISALIFFGGFVLAGITDKKQGLHDRVSNCLVSKREHVSLLYILSLLFSLLLAWACINAAMPQKPRLKKPMKNTMVYTPYEKQYHRMQKQVR